MLKLGETRKIICMFLILFGPVIFTKDLLLCKFVNVIKIIIKFVIGPANAIIIFFTGKDFIIRACLSVIVQFPNANPL